VEDWKINRPFPRGPLIASISIVVAALVAAITASTTGIGRSVTELPPAVESRDLMFSDRADGAVIVADASAPTVPTRVIMPGTDGFIRVALRGLVVERERNGVGNELGFRLMRSAENRMWLIDLATGSKVEVSAFGPQNRNVFAELLPSGRNFQPAKAAP
jgi:putative photosynthetic complex assembly protein